MDYVKRIKSAETCKISKKEVSCSIFCLFPVYFNTHHARIFLLYLHPFLGAYQTIEPFYISILNIMNHNIQYRNIERFNVHTYYNYYLVSSAFNFFVGDAKHRLATSTTSSMKLFLRSTLMLSVSSAFFVTRTSFSSNLFLHNFCLLCLTKLRRVSVASTVSFALFLFAFDICLKHVVPESPVLTHLLCISVCFSV